MICLTTDMKNGYQVFLLEVRMLLEARCGLVLIVMHLKNSDTLTTYNFSLVSPACSVVRIAWVVVARLCPQLVSMRGKFESDSTFNHEFWKSTGRSRISAPPSAVENRTPPLRYPSPPTTTTSTSSSCCCLLSWGFSLGSASARLSSSASTPSGGVCSRAAPRQR